MATATEPSAPRGPRDVEELERGLDALEESLRPRPVRVLRRVWSAVWPVGLALGLLLLIWQSAVWLHLKKDYQLPTPHQVWSALGDQADSGVLGHAIWTSVRRGIEGYALVIVVATVLGLVIATVRPVRAAVRPLLVGMQTAPSICWVPPTVLMFGITQTTFFVIMLLSATPAVANGLVAGLDQVPPVVRRAGRVLGARGITQARLVLLPAAMPAYVAGIRQGWAFAWHALMTAELISFSPQLGIGVGHLLDNARQISDIAGVFAAVIVIIALGVLAEQCVFAPLERGVLRRRGLAVS
jgi:NitT/TauT family transport system permease protein